jgi:hypothetical protein
VSPAQQDLRIEVDPHGLARIVRAAKAFDANLAKSLRKRLREAAQVGQKDVQRRLQGRSFHIDEGLARGLARGTTVSVRSGTRSAGVSIRTSAKALPADKAPMVRAYNKPSFRRRVYGRDVWVEQKGRPYFGAVLDEHKEDMRVAVETAISDAAKILEGTTAR